MGIDTQILDLFINFSENICIMTVNPQFPTQYSSSSREASTREPMWNHMVPQGKRFLEGIQYSIDRLFIPMWNHMVPQL
jgi:hypothetical protein